MACSSVTLLHRLPTTTPSSISWWREEQPGGTSMLPPTVTKAEGGFMKRSGEEGTALPSSLAWSA